MIVLICGPDAALARASVQRVLDRYDPRRENTSVLDGRSVTLSNVITHVGSPGFLGQCRVVVVSDLMARASRPRKGTTDPEEVSPSALDLAPLFASVAPGNVLVLVDPELGAVPASIKKIAPAKTERITGAPPRGTALLAWIADAARDAGSSLDQSTARYLADWLFPRSWSNEPANPRYDRPPGLDLLRTEIEKLAAAAHPGPIQRRHVDLLAHRGEQDQIFRFTDAVAQQRLPAALQELTNLLDAGEEPYRLAAQMYQQLELSAVLAEAGPGRDPVTIGRELGLSNPNRMASIAASRRHTTGAASLRGPLRTERLTKRGWLRKPEDAIFHLLTDGVSEKEEDGL